jgi:hypothetical protein
VEVSGKTLKTWKYKNYMFENLCKKGVVEKESS